MGGVERQPDGFAAEPDGWRDRDGNTALDVLDAYRAARFDLDREWAHTFPDGDRQEIDPETLNEAVAAWQSRYAPAFALRIGSFLTPEATAALRGPEWAAPSPHDPERWQVVRVERVRAGFVRAFVEVPDPLGFATDNYRYELKKVDGVWRLDKGFGLMPDTGRAYRLSL